MNHITYSELVSYYGRRQALKFLSLLERLGQIKSDIIMFDLDARFQNALEALNNIDFA
jgi:hypothetical protein